MKILEKMILSNNRYLKIISENDGKQNNFFDEIIIYYYINRKKTILFKDFLGQGIRALVNVTSKVMDNKLIIDHKYVEKGIGYEWNIINNKIANDLCEKIDDTIVKYSIWSTTSKYCNETWMYNYNNKIYFEVSKNYRWNYDTPKGDDDFITFEQFKSTYKVYDIVELNYKSVEYLNYKSKIILNNMKI